MDCLKCSTKNSEGRKFCSEYGALIVNICQKCEFINSLTDKYCGGCGANLLDMKTSEIYYRRRLTGHLENILPMISAN